MHDGLGAWLAAGQIAFIIFRAFSLLILQAERGQNALRDQLERDWLTGALNRAGLDRVAKALAQRSRETRLTAMMLDVDRFKALNDSQGHTAGDAALRSLADIVHAAIGEQGYLVRWGGDEFVCLLPGIGIDRARILGADIASQFAQTMIGQGAVEIRPSVSIGIVEGDAADGIADLIARADRAMYIAKGDRSRSSRAFSKAA
nr:GGDEF domain-containing protein [Sphingomonas faeni]